MRNFLLLVILCALGIPIQHVYGQTANCDGKVSNGQNLVVNGDFSAGYSGWTHDPLYSKYTPCNGCYSVPGRIYVGATEQSFNLAFPNQPDHSSTADDQYLMVDGICQAGVKLWSQSNIPVEPETWYFFTVHINSLKNSPNYPGTLQFDINGANLTAFPIEAPGVINQWDVLTATWYSGLTPPATVTISIENTTTVGCGGNNGEVDFGIDDISFSPGCEFGSPGPLPDLGPDFSVCGKTYPFNLQALDPAVAAADPTLIYTWFKNGVAQVAPNSNTFAVTTAPAGAADTFSVCVQTPGGCPKTDIIVITTNYSIALSDQVLCEPVVGYLDAVHAGQGVTYQWFKGGVAITGATSRIYEPTSAGSYSVTVNDPSCGSKSATANITTQTVTPVDATYCVADGITSATLSVTDTIPTEPYKWYDQPTGGSLVGVGQTLNLTGLTSPGPHTYYVEDTSTFRKTVGPSSDLSTNGFTNLQNFGVAYNDSKNILVFNALQDIKIDSITVYRFNYFCGAGTMDQVNFVIYDALGAVVGTSNYSFPCTGQGQPVMTPVKVPVGISVPEGNGYQIRLGVNSNAISLHLNTTGVNGNPPSPELYHFPTAYESALEIVSNSSADFNLYSNPNAYPGYFDWVITKGVPCARVPVSAKESCTVVNPPTCTVTKPTTATVEGQSSFAFCNNGSQPTIDLEVTGPVGGQRLVWYSDNCTNGTEVGRNTTGATITIPAPTVTTTYFARWESDANGGCVSACESVPVTVVEPPSLSVPGVSQGFCNRDSTMVEAVAPVAGTGTWTSPTLTFADPSDNRQTLTNIPEGSHKLIWTVTNGVGVCFPSTSKDSLMITRSVLNNPIIANIGQTLDTCANVTGLVFATIVDNSSNNSSYSWSGTGTLNIVNSSGNSATVDVGATGGVLTVTEEKGECVLDTFVTINVLPDISMPNAGADQISCINSAELFASPLDARSTGLWTVANGMGTGIFADAANRLTDVTGLSNGVNAFVWTVTGCGGPLSDTVEVNVSTSGMVLDAFGPSDTLCVNVERGLRASITGGSGDYQYHWVSSDNSFSLSTNSTSVTVKPNNNLVTYYVYATDNIQGGCISNIDSVKVNSLFKQNLKFNNLLTPNEDGFNDKLIVRDGATLQGILPGASLEIYNNWGGKVYYSENYDNGWKANGLADGVYFYHLETGCGGEIYKGWIQIISNTNQ